MPRRDERYEDDAYDEDEFDESDEFDEEPEEPEEPPRRRRAPARREISAPQAAQAGLRQIVELTGKDASGVVFVERAEDGWSVGVEMVEDRRIPSSSDILGLYQVQIGPDGDLTTYRRTRRYARGRGDSSEVV